MSQSSPQSVGIEKALSPIDDKDLTTLWSELKLGKLLDSDVVPLQDQVAASLRGNLPETIVKHEKRWQKPNYAVLKSRYQSHPEDPPVLYQKKLERLADPLRGRYKAYDDLVSHDVITMYERDRGLKPAGGVGGGGSIANNRGDDDEDPADEYGGPESLDAVNSDMKLSSNKSPSPQKKSTVVDASKLAFFLTEAAGGDDDEGSIRSQRSLSKLALNTAGSNGIVASKVKQKLLDARVRGLGLSNSKSGKIIKPVLATANMAKKNKAQLQEQLKKRKGSTGTTGKLGFKAPQKKVLSSGYGASNTAGYNNGNRRGGGGTKPMSKSSSYNNIAAKYNQNSTNNSNNQTSGKPSSIGDGISKRRRRLNDSNLSNNDAKRGGGGGGGGASRLFSENRRPELLPGGRVRPRSNYLDSSSDRINNGGINGRGKNVGGGRTRRGTMSAPTLLERVPEKTQTRGRGAGATQANTQKSSREASASRKQATPNQTHRVSQLPPKPNFLNASLPVQHRDTAAVVTVLEEVERKEGNREGNNATNNKKPIRGKPKEGDVTKLLQKVKNIDSKLDFAKKLSASYKDIGNEHLQDED